MSEGSEQPQAPWLAAGDEAGEQPSATSLLGHRARLLLRLPRGSGRPPLTALACALDPAGDDPTEADRLLEAGLGVAVLDAGRGAHEQLAAALQLLREGAARRGARLGLHWPVAVALDTAGPAVRTGQLGGSSGALHLDPGDPVTLTTETRFAKGSAIDHLYVDHPVTDILSAGDVVLLDDGLISLVVQEVGKTTVTCEVQKGGALGSCRTVNIPGVRLDLPALSDKDLIDIHFGVEQGVDIVLAPSVRSAETVRQVRAQLGEQGGDILVFAKIENEQGVENIDEIIEESDGIAMGLGASPVELPPDKALLAQKSIVAKCNLGGKPALCAVRSAAEAATAVLDGADCVLLEADMVAADARVVLRAAEAALWGRRLAEELVQAATPPPAAPATAAAAAAVVAALLSRAAAVIVLTVTGWSAHCVARFRPPCAIFAVTRNSAVARRCRLLRAVTPLLYMAPPLEDWPRDTDLRIQFALSFAMSQGIVGCGDAVVLVSGWRPGPGNTNKVRIMYAPPLRS